MPALRATGAGEAVREDAALEVATELTLDVAGNRAGVVVFAYATAPLAATGRCVMAPLGSRKGEGV